MRRFASVFSFVMLALFAAPPEAVVASSAGDLCAASADPCVVSQPLVVEAGSVLDLGLRTLRIEGAGVIEFRDGRGQVLCGRLETLTSGAALRARADSPAAELVVEARGRCSAAPRPCLDDSDCAGAGLCSHGDGSIDLRGDLHGSSASPGRVVLRSAGNLAVRGAVSVAGTRAASDGGSLDLVSARGSILLEGSIDVSGGASGGGGDVSASAATDVDVRGRILATGGEYDGGSVSLEGGRDVTITDDVAVDATGGAGAGGEIDVVAGRDIVLGGGTLSNNVVLGADGHQSAENEGGDGGAMSFEADASVRVGEHVRFAASAAAPDGFGDSLSFSAEVDVEIDGSIVAKGRGAGGGGALVDVYAGRDVRVGAQADLDLTGAAAGGDLLVEAGAAFSFDGVADVSGGASGLGGRIVTVSVGDSRIAGAWTTAGAESVFTVGELFVEGCRVRVDGRLANDAAAGRNRIVAHESVSIGADATIVASGEGGRNVLRHRGDAAEQVIAGVVAPAPSVVVDATLAPCAVCGDFEIEVAESCDDGNSIAGDGCSPRCEDEGCVAGTAGYPLRPICDDANACTVDRCDVSRHRCEHVAADCRDGIDCTIDACVSGGCVHTPAHALCNDANVCTADFCDERDGCMHTDSAGACDDGAFCNGADSCAGGACAGHTGDPCASGTVCSDRCDEARDSCFAPAGTACAEDANVCTDDTCDGNGSCVRAPNEEFCEDGDLCTTAERCRDGVCGDDAVRPLRVVRLRLKPGAAAGEDRLSWKASIPSVLVPADPAAASVRVVLADSQMEPLVDVVLPAGALVRDRTAWQFARRDGEASFVERLAIDAAGRDGRTRVRARLSGLEMSDAPLADLPRLTLMFGEESAEASCLASAALECRGANGRLVCQSP